VRIVREPLRSRPSAVERIGVSENVGAGGIGAGVAGVGATLPFTGGSSLFLAGLAAILVVVGFVLITLVSRASRRRT
jgi:hypothetical protein